MISLDSAFNETLSMDQTSDRDGLPEPFRRSPWAEWVGC